MELNLEKLDDLVKNFGDKAPAALFQDASIFNQANLNTNEEGGVADIIGK